MFKNSYFYRTSPELPTFLVVSNLKGRCSFPHHISKICFRYDIVRANIRDHNNCWRCLRKVPNGKRIKKQGFIHGYILCFSALSTRALPGYLFEVFSGQSWLSLFGADSLSRSVHCAPDENDRPSEQTKIFKLTSVYVPVYISELTRT